MARFFAVAKTQAIFSSRLTQALATTGEYVVKLKFIFAVLVCSAFSCNAFSVEQKSQESKSDDPIEAMEAEMRKMVLKSKSELAKIKAKSSESSNSSFNNAIKMMHSPKVAESKAKFLRQFYLSLVNEGFTKEEAMEIVLAQSGSK